MPIDVIFNMFKVTYRHVEKACFPDSSSPCKGLGILLCKLGPNLPKYYVKVVITFWYMSYGILQVELPASSIVNGVILQGRETANDPDCEASVVLHQCDEWVTKFQVLYSASLVDGNWKTVSDYDGEIVVSY